jgi:hypothetical protein
MRLSKVLYNTGRMDCNQHQIVQIAQAVTPTLHRNISYPQFGTICKLNNYEDELINPRQFVA